MLRHPLAALIDLALPPRCPGCRTMVEADHLFCANCWNALIFLNGPACQSCARPFAYNPGPDVRCAACLAQPPAVTVVQAAIAYGDIARQVVVRMKHGQRPGLAQTLARMLVPYLTAADALLIPVPLHRWRIWRRGYNQAALLAEAIGRISGHDYALNLLERRKSTPMLRGLGRAERAKTLRGAFIVRPDKAALVHGRRLILIDDVYTSGATVNACATALRKAGAARVDALCWARVCKDD
jgi:ComF family protein